MKNKKIPRLKKISTIRHRLHKIWSTIVRERANYTCELCGIKKASINKNDKPEKIDAHHFLSKEIKDCPLKFEILNGISVCTFCHKFGIPSFHRDPIRTITWLQKERPDRYNYVLKNADIRVDLENRKVLEEIENRLKKGLSLDLQKLQEIDKQYPRKNKKEITKGTLFDSDPKSSSSSSES